MAIAPAAAVAAAVTVASLIFPEFFFFRRWIWFVRLFVCTPSNPHAATHTQHPTRSQRNEEHATGNSTTQHSTHAKKKEQKERVTCVELQIKVQMRLVSLLNLARFFRPQQKTQAHATRRSQQNRSVLEEEGRGERGERKKEKHSYESLEPSAH